MLMSSTVLHLSAMSTASVAEVMSNDTDVEDIPLREDCCYHKQTREYTLLCLLHRLPSAVYGFQQLKFLT